MADKCNCRLKIIFSENQPEIKIKDNKLKVNLSNQFKVNIPVAHNELQNLDYESSGHTGFASSKQVTQLSGKVDNAFDDIEMQFDDETGKLYLILKSINGVRKNVEVDLPTEELVKNVSYDKSKNELLIEWQNGQITNIPIETIFKPYNADGVTITLDVSTNTFKINNEWLENLDKRFGQKVNVDGNKVLSTNDFTNEYKKKLENLKNYELPNDVVRDVDYVHTDNNYTDEEKEKLANLRNYENDFININNQINNIENNKADKTDIPTRTNQLINDSEFITRTVGNLANYYLKSETYTKEEVLTLIGQISVGLSIKIVTYLPSTNISTNTIYLLKKESTSTQNIYDEYIYVNGSWEKIGDTQINLDGYAKLTDIPTKVSELEIDIPLGLSQSEVINLFQQNIVNNLNDGGINKALSAEQGKELKLLIDKFPIKDLGHSSYSPSTSNFTLFNDVKVAGLYTFTYYNKPYLVLVDVQNYATQISQRYISQNGKDDCFRNSYDGGKTWNIQLIENEEIQVVDNLESNDTQKALSANQGRILNEKGIVNNTSTTTIAVGGIAKGTSLYGLDVKTIIENIFFPYVAFSMGSMSSSPNASGVYEKGTNVTLNSINVPITLGSKDLTSLILYDSNGVTVLGTKFSGITSSNTFANLSKSITSSSTFRAIASDGTTTLSKNLNVFNFVDPYFYGSMPKGYSVNTSTVRSGTKTITTKGNKTYSFTTVERHPFIAYPSSYGTLTSILDANNFENIDNFTKYIVSISVASGTVSYNVYVQKNAPTLSAFSYTFKF